MFPMPRYSSARWSPLARDRFSMVVLGSLIVMSNRWRKFVFWSVALVCVGTLSAPAIKDLRDRLVPKRFGVVEPGQIYRSGQLHRALVRNTLQKNHIAVVIDLTCDDPDNPDQRAEQIAIRDLGLIGYRFPMSGNGTGDPDHVARAVAALAVARDQGRPTLVHCAAGTQRTGCIVAIYRLLVRGDSPRDVLAELQLYGWHPHRHRVLLDFLSNHLPEIAERLVQLGTLSHIPKPIPVLTIDSEARASEQTAAATVTHQRPSRSTRH